MKKNLYKFRVDLKIQVYKKWEKNLYKFRVDLKIHVCKKNAQRAQPLAFLAQISLKYSNFLVLTASDFHGLFKFLFVFILFIYSIQFIDII